MDVGIRYWDEVKGLLQTRYFDSKFLKCSNAETLCEKIMEFLTELDSTLYGRSMCLLECARKTR